MRIIVLLFVWAVLLAAVENEVARDRAARRRAFLKMRATSSDQR